MKFKYIFSFFIFLSACTHLPKPQIGNTLFPVGTYKHRIEVTVADSTYPARGVLRVSPSDLYLFALGPMDVTAAKIRENFEKNTTHIEITMEQFKKHERMLQRVYPLLRSFILYARNQASWGLLKTEHFHPQGYPELLSGPRDVKFAITEFKNDRPTQFQIFHPQFSVTVEEIP